MKNLLCFFLFFVLYVQANTITHLRLDGAIGPASSDYLKSGLAYARENNSSSVLFSFDTPGGLATSMREMIQEILNSPIPVIVYVSPKGARAASAGTYLLYASHLAVMSPGTNLGAATPVSMMKTPQSKDLNLSTSAMEKKVINDSIAYIKSLAQLRDRNISWAMQAVKEGESLSAEDALKSGVIELIAEDEDELFAKAEGKLIKIAKQEYRLSFTNATHIHYKADWKNRFLSILTNPNIAYILLMLGIYGIFFELTNPGGIYPGLIGLISGILAMYALNLLPFSYAGLLLIILGIALMVAEVFASGFGILGISGLISFTLGSILLFDAKTIGEDISLPLIISFALSSLAFFLLLVRFVLSSRNSKIVSGADEMIGTQVRVIEVKDGEYRVEYHGEIWSAQSEEELALGEISNIESISELTLILRRQK